MIFSVGRVDFVQHKRKIVVDDNLFSDYSSIIDIQKVEKVNNFYCFKVQKEVYENAKGVILEGSDPVQVDTFISLYGGKKIIQLTYIFFNISNYTFYYSCSRKFFELVLNRFFKVDAKDINYSTNYEELERINTLRLVQRDSNDIFNDNIDHINLTVKEDFFDVMEKSENPYREEYQLEYQSGIFKKEKLKKLVDKYENNSNIELYIKGVDKKGNAISINKAVIKKIDVETLKDFDNVSSMSFHDILLEIMKKV